MSKPMSEQMQKLAARYEKATGKKFNAKTNAQKNPFHDRRGAGEIV